MASDCGPQQASDSFHLVNRLDASRSPLDGCHVMERESFESPDVAALLNEHFIPIKVDREERPDIDAVYMQYVQATTGSGGWPLNVFLTPDLEPVFGGTYFPGPSESSHGSALADHVGFLDILKKLRTVWAEQEGKCRDSAKDIISQLRKFAEEGVHGEKMSQREGEALEIELLEEACSHFATRFDKVNGGFSSAPKFPTPVNLSFLLHLGQWRESVKHVVGEEDCDGAKHMVLHTLRCMARGGIRDQIGYGFARYSVTKDWGLPHFEKMLYDQSQLLNVYLDAFLINRDPEMLGAVYDISTYLTTAPLAASTGGFFSAEDADSYPTRTAANKREGAYYVWTLKELRTLFDSHVSDILAGFYGVNEEGNVSRAHDPHQELVGQNVLKISNTPSALAAEFDKPESDIIAALKSGRQKIREHRDAHRPRPALDDKIVVAWNGLAIGALARTSAALRSIDTKKADVCLKSAVSAAEFIKRELFDRETRTLYRIYRSGRGDTKGLCDDYAFLIHGLIDLYEATFDDSHLQFADDLQKIQLEKFRDVEGGGGFFTTPSPHPPDLLLRLKNGMDSAEPSSNSVSANNLWRLSSMLDDEDYAKVSRETVMAFEAEIEQFPHTFAGMLGSVVMGRLGVKGVVLSGQVQEGVIKKLRESVRPGTTVVAIGNGLGEWLRKRNALLSAIDAETPNITVCEGRVCRQGSEFL
ncbi:uncharacterized protein KY384_000242 [Bacidia gigantensis]|uniref:uncharacterized protein n=1 Tax=Bacidia gigantensis TaxID=2732470 RepID=UPI001D04C34F|nr:uncharacterized protein KY384_000242 [Bacidia gigantensis]KAG8526249.1 hypothetical protein KY384_000242 [Bacidia gigantensis]